MQGSADIPGTVGTHGDMSCEAWGLMPALDTQVGMPTQRQLGTGAAVRVTGRIRPLKVVGS